MQTTRRPAGHRRQMGIALVPLLALGASACDGTHLERELGQHNAGLVSLSAPDQRAISGASPELALEREIIELLNAERARRGLAALTSDPSLAMNAREHAVAMASRKSLSHQNLRPLLDDWRIVGENVGQAGSVSSLHRAWLASPDHLANIVRREFTTVGIGVHVDGDGRVWATQVYAGRAI